jgi:two-component system phosphate regulon sensor histidine kinase PhoR
LVLVVLAAAGLGLALGAVLGRAVPLPAAVVAGLLLALGLAGAGGLAARRWLTGPLRAMRATVERMAAGDFTGRVTSGGPRELAELGESLDGLTRTLDARIGSLHAEEAKVRAILDGMIEGVVAVDARGRILFMNPAARPILELDGAPVEGRPLLEVIRQKELFDLVETVRLDRAPQRREVELPPPIARALTAHAAPLALEPAGSGILLVLHDVTELRRLERARTEFVANVSHELRTPLTCIKGYLETLLDGALEEPDNARRFLEVASGHARRLERLVDDLMELAGIESGRTRLSPEAVDLRGAVDAVKTVFEGRAAGRGLQLWNDVAAAERVRVDPDRLTQILVNLVDNAVKFTGEGGRISFAATRAPGGFVEVRVSDTGVGIPSTDLPRITERFYRVDRARSRELGGTGLGLAIVKHLVQAHGGQLRIDSTLGRGTTVRFTLPAV